MYIIKQKNVRKVPSAIAKTGAAQVQLVVPFDPEFEGLKKYHLTELKSPGDRMLPPVRGAATRRNIEGRVIVHRNLPKEPRSWSILWGREQFCGRGETEWVEDFVTRTQMCYPRTIVPAEGVELSLFDGKDGLRIGTDAIDVSSEERLVVAINVMLEVFGACWVIDPANASVSLAPVRRINWRLLPPGKSPWPVVRQHLQEVVKNPKARVYAMRNLERFYQGGAKQVIVGQGGFEHYIGFLYPDRKIVILESVKANNATYVFGENWEALTKLSKAELIDGELHQDRIIHDKSWAANMKRWLGKDAA